MTTLTAPPNPMPGRTQSQAAFDAAMAALMTWYPTNHAEMVSYLATLTSIAAGTAMAIPYTFSTTTVDSDPGAGFLRFDNATQNAATTIRADLVGADGSTWTSVLDTFDDSTSAVRGHIMLQKLGDATKWLLFSVSSLASPTGYKNITVANVASSAASPFADNDSIVLKFTRNGDKGDSGGVVNGGTASGNYSYTAASGSITVTPTAPGQYVTLDDARNFSTKGVLGSIQNASGDYALGVKNNAGTVLGWLKPYAQTLVGCSDNTTQAGTWGVNLDKLGITAFFTSPSASNTGKTSFQRITVDANRTAFVFGGTSCYVLVYDSSQAAGSQWGSPTLVRSGLTSGSWLSILSGAAQLLVVSCDNTTAMEAVTVTLTGGTGVTVNSGSKGSATLAGNWASFGQLIAVGTSWVVSYGRATNVSAIRAITISSTTPTIGSESALPPSNTTSGTLYAVDSTHVLTITASGTTMEYKPYSVSGSSLSAGTGTSGTATASSYRSLALGSGRWLSMYVNTTAFASIISVNTGTNTATASSATFGTAFTNVTTIDAIAISGTKVAVCYNAGGATINANIITDSAGTISNGTEVSQVVAGNASSGATAAISVSNNTALFSVGTATTQYSFVLDVSGASPVISNLIPLIGVAGAKPGASDIYGNRSSLTLVAGNDGYSVSGTEANGGNTRFSTSAVRAMPVLDLPMVTSPGAVAAGYAAGAGASKSWVVETINNSATGIAICQVEAAA